VPSVKQKKLYRVLDANFNRAKEGLRVCEDTCRFFLDNHKATGQYKSLRHKLTGIAGSLDISDVISARDVHNDVGRGSTAPEFKRKDIADIFYANSQRAKESVRVLEEFTKLLSRPGAQELKKIRYKVYALEKDVVQKL